MTDHLLLLTSSPNRQFCIPIFSPCFLCNFIRFNLKLIFSWIFILRLIHKNSLSMAGEPSPSSEIHLRVNSRKHSNVIHPAEVEPALPYSTSTVPVEYREVKHYKRWFPWLIPIFVVANVVVFVITMYVNNCPKNSGSCIIRFLGRFSFQPFKENPLLGPSSLT